MTGVWLRPVRMPRSGPPLSRERIATAAVALLDDEEAAGLTMRRLAERLGAAHTTLYWHVATKDDVVDLALDHIFGEVPIPGTRATDWRVDVRSLITDWRAAMLRHPWSAALLGRPMLGPNVLTRTEFLQSTLLRAGLTEPALSAATHALANYVIGSALTQSTWHHARDPEAIEAARQHLQDQRESFPTLAAHGHLDEADPDDRFHRGLGFLLAGITAGT